MKTAAMTRIHRCEEFLGIWLGYYSRYFDDLIVFAGRNNGKDPKDFSALAKKYKFEMVDLKDEMYNMATHERIFARQKELLVDHSWVLYSDADEIVVADPEKYDGLRHFMDVCREDQTYCVGYDVFKTREEGPLNYDLPILQQRTKWCKDSTKSYNKPCLSRIPTAWLEGFHYHHGQKDEYLTGSVDTGLYLAHLKHADPDREFDYPRNNTGTHGEIGGFAENGVLIPEKVRRMF